MSIQRLAAIVALAVVALALPVRAQADTSLAPKSPLADTAKTGHPVLRALAGRSGGSALYGGWWTLHLRNMRKGIRDSRFYGATIHGVCAGTFITSYGDRAVLAAVQRDWLAVHGREAGFRLGYRAGLLYGYDAELLPIAGRVPVLPMVETMMDVSFRRVGVQVSYAGIVVTAGTVIRF